MLLSRLILFWPPLIMNSRHLFSSSFNFLPFTIPVLFFFSNFSQPMHLRTGLPEPSRSNEWVSSWLKTGQSSVCLVSVKRPKVTSTSLIANFPKYWLIAYYLLTFCLYIRNSILTYNSAFIFWTNSFFFSFVFFVIISIYILKLDCCLFVSVDLKRFFSWFLTL